MGRGHRGMGIFFEGIRYTPRHVSVDIFQAAAGDINGDHMFDSDDIQLLLGANGFNNDAGGPFDWLSGDTDGDGDVDSDDVQAMLGGGLFGTGIYAAFAADVAVPEPSSLFLAVLALLGILAYPRRGNDRGSRSPL